MIIFKGHVDCMDGSDEMSTGTEKSCSFMPNAMECDEHICPRQSYSCGDGQCVHWITRMAFQRFVAAQEDCYTKRNLNYMCESSPHRRAWTLPNGLCSSDEGFDNITYSPWNMMNASTLTNNEKCQYLLRCALSDGFEHDCPCNRLNCTQIMASVCQDGILIYPPSSLIHPNVLLYYNYDHSKNNLSFGGLIVHGTGRCRGYQFTMDNYVPLQFSLGTIMYATINNVLCLFSKNSAGHKNYSSIYQYDQFCYNDSLTFNGHRYAVNPDACHDAGQCISQYRIHDGFSDCLFGEDENTHHNNNYCTGQVEKYRFQCYDDEHKCLPLSQLGTETSECSNGYDEMWYGSGKPLANSIKCQKDNTVDCNRLKEYIRQSTLKNASSFDNMQQQTSINHIPFRSYCDSFWDLDKHIDEWPSSCQYWVCQKNQYQCRTGQCIELDWVCDGEWDCPDASDEEAIALTEHWSAHNARLDGFASLIQKCRQRYRQTPFSNICNTSSEFGCYLSGVSNPLDLNTNRPCINLTQLGDGKIDCYNAYDERNSFESNSDTNTMLGFHLRCGNHSEPYLFACFLDKKNNCTEVLCLNHRSEDQICSSMKDAVCLNGACVKNARCNGIFDCLYGEDEYWCASGTLMNQIQYRHDKTLIPRPDNLQFISQFPYHQHRAYTREKQLSNSIVHSRKDSSFLIHSYYCNRGVAVLQMNEIVCLCPPAYYGRKCEFFSDRISIIAHMDQQTMPKNTLKIRANLLFEDKVIDTHEFTIVPTVESLKRTKHKFYLLYSRSTAMLLHKQRRYFNRTDIITNHPYSVHFDVFSLENDNHIKELGAWRYPIYFDYLPAYRLAVILKFPTWFSNHTNSPCSQNVCNQNSICMPILNQNHSYYCSCKSGYYGQHCEMYDRSCETHCSVDAICRTNPGQLQPSCICPQNRFGPRCNLQYSDCSSNSCLNSGTCISTANPSGEAAFLCVCSKRFYGDRCQYEMGSVHIDINMTNISSTHGTVVQLYNFKTSPFQLVLQHQQVHHAIPSKVIYYHSHVRAPSLGVLKVYENLTHPQYFIIYNLISRSIINITSIPQHCPHVSSLLLENSNDSSSVPAVFKYHYICRNDISRLCFYDENYLCICETDHYRAECFSHDTNLDHCNHCFSGGKCLLGDRNDPADFICLCPPSYYGHRCEFSLEFFNTTTRSTPSSSSTKRQIGYGFIVFLLFIYNFNPFYSYLNE